MTPTKAERKGRIFAAELKSKRALRSVSLGNGTQDGVLIEGSPGFLVGATFQDGVVLEVAGTEGTLRVDLMADEISAEPARSPIASDDRGRDQ